MKVGLVGCGRWGERILRDLRELGVRVVVSARSDESRARASQYADGQHVVPSPESLPEDLAGIVVATPTSTHAEIVLRLLPRRVPLFVEKPVAASVGQARELLAAGRGLVYVMDKWRYHPGVLDLRRHREAGTFGELLGLSTVRTQQGNPHPDVPTLWTYLPHDLAIALEILGELPKARAAVEASSSRGQVFTGLLGGKPWVSVELSSLGEVKKVRKVTAFFEKATVTLHTEGFRSALVNQDPREGAADASRVLTLYPYTEPLYSELEAFLGYLRGGPSPKSALEEGVIQVERIEELLALAAEP